jgi:hypothetical protein
MAPSETVRKSLAAFERVGFGLVPATESGAGKKLVHGERQTYCGSRHINQSGGPLGSLSSPVRRKPC